MAPHRSSASPLALLFAALIVYASLYPFSGWRIPGVSPLAFLGLGWPHWWTWFDLVANLFGYLPLGALIFGSLVRTGNAPRPAFGGSVVLGILLSFTMEFLQNFLPTRVSSNVDLGLNSLGTLLGAMLGLVIHSRGGVERWQSARDRWFIAAALAVWRCCCSGRRTAVPAAGSARRRPGAGPGAGRRGRGRPRHPRGALVRELGRRRHGPLALVAAGEFSLIALGLMAPCTVAFSIARPGWRRLVLVLGAAAIGCLTTTLSTALNFGPQHALAWSTPQALGALMFSMLLAALISAAPRRAAAGLGLMALTALVTVVAQAPSDPYFAQSLQAWEQGRFIRFHGAARWVGWLLALMAPSSIC